MDSYSQHAKSNSSDNLPGSGISAKASVTQSNCTKHSLNDDPSCGSEGNEHLDDQFLSNQILNTTVLSTHDDQTRFSSCIVQSLKSSDSSHLQHTIAQKLSNRLSSTLNIGASPPSLKESHAGLLTLPREIRDEIYGLLLSNAYLVKNAKAFSPEPVLHDKFYMIHEIIPAFPELMHPRFRRPQSIRETSDSVRETDDVAPWNEGLISHDMFRRCERIGKENENDALLEKRWKFAKLSQFFPLLRTSTSIYHEAIQVLYERGTFFFNLNQPLEYAFRMGTDKRMKKIYINVDLLRAHIRERSTGQQAYTFEAFRRLLRHFAGDQIERTSCVINFHRGESTAFLLVESLERSLKTLIGFKTVVIRVALPYEGWWQEEMFHISNLLSPLRTPRQLFELNCIDDITNLDRLDHKMQAHFGPSIKEYEREKFFCLIYHPRAHLTGTHPPNFDVDELEENPGRSDSPVTAIRACSPDTNEEESADPKNSEPLSPFPSPPLRGDDWDTMEREDQMSQSLSND
ncbi:hypothetical protein ACLMJK_001618 [Lecanora helva]